MLATMLTVMPVIVAVQLASSPATVPQTATESATGTAAETAAAAIPRNLLTPLPRLGAVPPIVQDPEVPSLFEIVARGNGRGDRERLATIVRSRLRSRSAEVRAEAFRELATFSDAAAMIPIVEALVNEDNEVRHWLIEHLAACGPDGQFGLAYAVVAIDDAQIRAAAVDRLERPLATIAMHAIDAGLRHAHHNYVNAAGWLAAQFNVIQAIPPLIFAQAAEARVESQGDLAWIAIGSTTAYVANLVPVVGGSAGAFQPVLGNIQTGTLLRVMDAVVAEGNVGSSGVLIGSSLGGRTGTGSALARGRVTAPPLGIESGRVVAYRLDAHAALVSLSSAAWGQPTDHLGYDMQAWYRWFNGEFVPHMRELDLIARVAADTGD